MNRRILVIIVVLAALARAIFWVAVVGRDAPLRGDEVDYNRLAVSLAEGRGFVTDRGEPTATRPPLFPLLLAGLYRVFGPSVAAARMLQIALGALIVLLLYALARRIFSPSVGLIAAALAAANPSLVFISSYLLVENLYIALLLAALLVLGGALERQPSWGRCVAGGLLFGSSCLARPNAFPFALFVIGSYLILGRGRAAGRLARSAVLVAALAAAVAPWVLRNEAQLGHFVPFTTHGGLTFYQGNNRLAWDEPSYRGGVAPLEALPGLERMKNLAGEVERDREAWRLGRTFIRDNRKIVPGMAASKFLRFWRLRGDAGLSGVKSGWWWNKGSTLGALASSIDAIFIYSIVAIPLFVAGLVLTFRRWRILFPLYGVVVVHTCAAMVFFGSLRMRMPVEPVIALFAAYAAFCLVSARRRRGTDREHFTC